VDENVINAKYREELETAKGYAEVWQIVKDTVESSLGRRRGGIMLFLDDLPLQLGAYHPVGTNNIVLNRTLVEVVEASEKSKLVVSALVYNLLLHEYLHALGELSEEEVKRLVVVVAKKCFGEEHIATTIARKNPWILLRDIPVGPINAPKRVMEIVKDLKRKRASI
jgi:hypothetical protein